MKILFYPDKRVAKGHKVRNYIEWLGYEILTGIENLEKCDIVWHWDYGNMNQVEKIIKESGKPIININCNNIKKDFVNRCFEKIFGYSLFINPLFHRGFAVQKSTRQAVHDGKIIECPVKFKSKKVFEQNNTKNSTTYQRLIDNRIFDTRNPVHCQGIQMLRDIRVPIVNGQVADLVWFKDKNIRNTFEPLPWKAPNRENLIMKCSLQTDVSKVFSEDEINKISEFCKVAGVDVADLDILRDNGTGLIYIIDINNIAANTLFKKLTKEEKELSLNIVSGKLNQYLNSLL